MSFFFTTLSLLTVLLTQSSQPATVDTHQLEIWLDDLGGPSYEVRQTAVKRLYSAGPAALAALRQVTQEDDYEAALRAKDLIERIQKLYLVGARIELSVSRKSLHWDQPVSLRIKIINPSEFPIHLPFLIENREAIDTDPTAVQLGNFLDAADFLTVIGPDDREVGLQVDDFRGYPALEAALDTRVYQEPASLLAGHREFVLHLESLNRGLARFPLLSKGEYRLQFAYVPEWDDPKMRESGVGRVTSNEIILSVTQSAPKIILHGKREIQTSLQQVGEHIVVHLTNTHDRAIGVNLNLGGKGLRDHAHIDWLVDSPAGPVSTAEPFAQLVPLNVKKLITLKPAQAIELLRTPLDHLQGLEGFEMLGPGKNKVRLGVRYFSLFDRVVLRRRLDSNKPGRKKWQQFYDAMPLPMFTGSSTSEFIELSPGRR